MISLDALLRVACSFGMNTSYKPRQIRATVTLSGPAEDVLKNVQSLRGCARAVSLNVEVDWKRSAAGSQTFPEIKGGDIQAALEKLQKLSQQTLVDSETDRRLEGLIRDFGRFTEG